MDNRFNRNLKIGYGFSFVMLVAVGLLSYFILHKLLLSNSEVAHGDLIILKLEKTLSLMKDAETGQRGYLLTGNEQFLEPYQGAYPQAKQLINEVTGLTSDNAIQQSNIATINEVLTRRMGILEKLVSKKRNGKGIDPDDIDEGKLAMDALRAAVERAEQEEQSLLAHRRAVLSVYTGWAPVLIIAAILTAFIIALFSYLSVARDIREKDHLQIILDGKERETATFNEELTATNEELRSANEELRATNEELTEARAELALVNNSLEEKILLRTKALQESEKKAQALNEELTATNEELAASNEEYTATNEELRKSRESLQNILNDLIISEFRSRAIVNAAPFPIGVYSGREMLIVMANQSIIDVWGKGQDVIGKTYSGLLPELISSGIYEQLDSVFTTGEPFHARNQRVDIVVDGRLQPFYFNYSFTALRDADGSIYGVMNTAAEITDLVIAKQQIEQSEAELLEIKKQLETELEISKQLQRQKDDFIGMASHELKTPLTSLSAVIQVTKAKLKSSNDPFLVQAMDKATMQVRRMSNMINGFLNVSRLESGKIEIVKKPFNLTDLLDEVIAEAELTATGLVIKFDDKQLVEVNADRDKISSVVSNLISNAIKYSPKGKPITVHCAVTDVSVTVSVKDEGFGISQQDAEKIFDRYYRVQTQETHHIAGFGIGLYLSAEIVRLHKGSIWVESEAGTGSVFYFSLPLTA